MTTKSPARIALEAAHTASCAATGRLSLILTSGRGLTPTALEDIAGALEEASKGLRDILKAPRE